jgi:hypothetical protein
MPTYFARKAGNINAADVWATMPSGTAAAVTFAAGDVLMANGFAITVNVSTDLGSTGQFRNDTNGGATNGGCFVITNGVNLVGNLFSGNAINIQLITTANLATSATISALNISSIGGFNSQHCILHSGGGVLNITGDCVGNSNSQSTIALAGGGTINFTGNATGGGASAAIGANTSTTGTINITGTVTGGIGFVGAINSSATATINIFGTAAGGTGAAGANNASTSFIKATRARGNTYGIGNTAGITAQVGISNAGLGIVEIEQLEYGTNGMSPTSGTGIRLKKASTNVAVFNYCDTAGSKTLIDATQNAAMPAATDVRSGVSYASGAQTGSCAVPAASSVALGVPVDAGFGTAVLTPEAVWGHASRTITGGTVTTLTNAPASVTPNDIWSHATRTLTTSSGPTAVEIRQEIDANSTKLDAAISSRLAGSAYTAPANSDITSIKAKTDNLPASPAATGDIPSANISAIKAKTDLLETTRLAQCSTVATTGAQLAAALS